MNIPAFLAAATIYARLSPVRRLTVTSIMQGHSDVYCNADLADVKVALIILDLLASHHMAGAARVVEEIREYWGEAAHLP